jgi:hypothetical protein
MAYFLLQRQNEKAITASSKKTVSQPARDILPGGNKAVLTLANGATIALDGASNGLLAQQGSINIQKLVNGQLAYSQDTKQGGNNGAAFYNTITTPRGGQYQATLTDGTKVWLNAASSIRFPVGFAENERSVEITGEVYFEVAKNAGKPFRVQTATSVVEVLGTHFNVNAYNDEQVVKTTLVEGKVRVNTTGSSVYLKPGQQSSVLQSGKIKVETNADVEEARAWKNGSFQFKSADLKTILRQIARWYDVDIIYKGDVNLHFTGQLTRNINASKVFEQLELTGEVHFKIDGRTVVVSP